MKTQYLLLALLLPICGDIYGQEDFEKYAREQETAFKTYSDHEERDFKEYCDSINREFGRYLAEAWADCPLEKPKRPIKTPIPPETFDPAKKHPSPVKIPVKRQIEIPMIPLPATPLPQGNTARPPLPVPPVKGTELKGSFFGTAVVLKKLDCRFPKLEGITEKQVATCWNALSALPHTEWTARMLRLKSALSLNDWGMYLLAGNVFNVYCPQGTENEKVIFVVFTLNQLGYKAKIGRTDRKLLPLIAFNCEVYNATSFVPSTERGVRYSIVKLNSTDLTTVQCCLMNHGNAERLVDASIPEVPRLEADIKEKTLSDGRHNYQLRYNRNLVDFYATVPCINFSLYAQAALDKVLWQSIVSQLQPILQGLSQEEAVNALLHFVQYAFHYKTDNEQFGYEKWFFAEETIASSFSDCEDRSILFAQLVRRLLKMPVVLIHYPGRHLATAVCFSNPATAGDYVTVDGRKYLLCDPTYIGASLGMGMPQLMPVPIEIIKLKKDMDI